MIRNFEGNWVLLNVLPASIHHQLTAFRNYFRQLTATIGGRLPTNKPFGRNNNLCLTNGFELKTILVVNALLF